MEHHIAPGIPVSVPQTPPTLHHVAAQQAQQPPPVPHLMHHHHNVAAQQPSEEHHAAVQTHHQHQPLHHQSHHSGHRGRAGQQHFCLRWNNFQMNITSVFEHLLRSETFVDVTLACDGSQIKAHKMVLSACSPYFQQLLSQNPCKHPIIILPAEVRMSEMKSIIEFVYRGEIDVAQEQLPDLLKVADALQIKGLCEVTEKGGVTAARGRNRHLHSYRPALRHSRLSHPFKYRRRHLENLTRRNFGRGGGRGVGNGPNRVAGMSGGVGLSAVKTEGNDEHIVKRENVIMHPSPGGVMNSSAQHHQQLGHHQTSEGQENQYFVLKPVGQHGMQPQSQGIDMLSPGMPMQQPGDNMVMMMPQEGEHPDYGQHQHQYQQQQVTYQASTTPVSLGYPMAATPQPMQTNLNDGQIHHHHSGSHLQHHAVMKDENAESDSSQFAVGPELLGLVSTSGECVMGSPSPGQHQTSAASMKNWTEQDLEQALDALRQKTMSLTRASAHFGIPSTTLWQRAHRAGVDIPRHMSPMKTWTDDDLRSALEAMRAGTLSAHRASKEYNIPSSTLYKIAKKEGIKLAQPFNSTPPSWSRDDLRRAFDAIKSGMSVTKASTEFGIPSGTLYGKCRREGIELRGSKESANWSEEDLVEALEAVRVGEMSINQASLHFSVPYSTLYNRFRKCAMAEEEEDEQHKNSSSEQDPNRVGIVVGPNGRVDPSSDPSQVVDVSASAGSQQGMDDMDMSQSGEEARRDSRNSPADMQQQQQQHYTPDAYQHHHGQPANDSGQIPLTPVPQS